MQSYYFGVRNYGDKLFQIYIIYKRYKDRKIVIKRKGDRIEIYSSIRLDEDKINSMLDELEGSKIFRSNPIYDENFDYFLGKKIKTGENIYELNNKIANQDNYYEVFKDEIFNTIKRLVNEELTRLNLSINRLKIGYFKSRFGSMNVKTKSLSINMIVIHYSEDVIKALIDHELAHLSFGNHSKDFYNKLLEYCPNYYELDKRLTKMRYNND